MKKMSPESMGAAILVAAGVLGILVGNESKNEANASCNPMFTTTPSGKVEVVRCEDYQAYPVGDTGNTIELVGAMFVGSGLTVAAYSRRPFSK